MDNQVFAQAKIEYNKQLLDILINPIFNKFRSIYTSMAVIFHIFTVSCFLLDLHEFIKHFFHGTTYRLQ